MQQIEYQNNIDDMVAIAQYYFENPKPAHQKARNKEQLVHFSVAFVLFVIFLIVGIVGGGLVGCLIGGTVLAILYSLSTIYFAKKFDEKSIRLAYSQGPLAAELERTKTVSINPESITFKTTDTTVTDRWSRYESPELIDDHVILYLNVENVAYAIPKRAFSSEEEFRQFGKDICGYHQAATEKTASDRS